jgi:hypothetical protein
MQTTANARRSLTPRLWKYRTTSRRASAVTTFLDDFPAYFDLQHRLCQQLVEPGVLSFELSEALGI